MIEMLGVLAIIGVLSAGGIIGYSAAMSNYRANKIAEDYLTFRANAATFLERANRNGVDNKLTTFDFCKVGVISQEYCKPHTGSNWIADAPFGNIKIAFYSHGRPKTWSFTITDPKTNVTHQENAMAEFSVVLWDLPLDICVKLLTRNWSGRTRVRTEVPAGSPIYPLPLTPALAKTMCNTQVTYSINNYNFHIYGFLH